MASLGLQDILVHLAQANFPKILREQTKSASLGLQVLIQQLVGSRIFRGGRGAK